eukprot:9677927-Alexandrium_andersonii.AAC.1
MEATGFRCSQPAPLLGPGVETPKSQMGKRLRHSRLQALRPWSRRTPRSPREARVRIIFREMIAFLMSGRPQTRAR